MFVLLEKVVIVKVSIISSIGRDCLGADRVLVLLSCWIIYKLLSWLVLVSFGLYSSSPSGYELE